MVLLKIFFFTYIHVHSLSVSLNICMISIHLLVRNLDKVLFLNIEDV